MINLATKLKSLGACRESLLWVRARPERGWRKAWETCPRGDWLLWIAATAGVDRRLVVQAACGCADQALIHVPNGEDRPRIAIETARRWAKGEASIEEVRRAAYAATNAAAYAAYAASYAYAANAAAYAAADAAAYAAADAAYAAAYAATNAANASAYAANAANAANAAESLKTSANIVRACIPYADVRRALLEVK